MIGVNYWSGNVSITVLDSRPATSTLVKKFLVVWDRRNQLMRAAALVTNYTLPSPVRLGIFAGTVQVGLGNFQVYVTFLPTSPPVPSRFSLHPSLSPSSRFLSLHLPPPFLSRSHPLSQYPFPKYSSLYSLWLNQESSVLIMTTTPGDRNTSAERYTTIDLSSGWTRDWTPDLKDPRALFRGQWNDPTGMLWVRFLPFVGLTSG